MGKIQKLATKGLDIVDYLKLLNRADVWAATGWQLPQQAFTERLDEVRQIRNSGPVSMIHSVAVRLIRRHTD
jgi:hypothetical protein